MKQGPKDQDQDQERGVKTAPFWPDWRAKGERGSRAEQSLRAKAFANPEDAVGFGKGDNAKKFLRTDPDVERVRRIHLNDLENIVPFLFIGFFYSFSGVSLSTALLHYRIFFASRIFHTVSYLIPLPQPSRGLAWFVGYLATFSMVYKLVMVSLSMS
uniref:Microsomal glutathione S-transferase 1 n=1 Tax=Anolis carolinensis TaxID=28377 RepID=A0A803TRV7_ANOCA